MDSILTILFWLEYIFIVYLVITSLYYLVFSTAGLFYREARNIEQKKSTNKFLVLIPAYKEDAVIIETAKSAISHKSYCDFDVTVIADTLKKETLESLYNLEINVEVVNFKKSTKVKALNQALQNTKTAYDYVVVLDADNIMADGFINHINYKLENSYKVVQGHRTAKNTNTDLAVLDSFSEEINNHIFRKGHSVLGLSAAIIGSGFAADFNLFKDMIHKMKAVGGFDKEMEVELLKNKIKIGYDTNAIVYDEKVQQQSHFSNQRKRWIAAQFFYLRKHFLGAIKELILRGNIDMFDKVWQFALLPRVISLVVLLTGSFLHLSYSLITNNFQITTGWLWWFSLLATSFSLLISSPKNLLKKKALKTIITLPATVWSMIKSMVSINGANKNFLHTPHGINDK